MSACVVGLGPREEVLIKEVAGAIAVPFFPQQPQQDRNRNVRRCF